jgi:hypothetical protein
VELTSDACTGCRDAGGRLKDPVPGLGLTVGKSCDGLMGATLVPGIGGSPISGGTLLDDDGGIVALLALTTTSVAAEVNECAPLADAFALSSTRDARGALNDTGTEASSSKTWPRGRLLILQAVPLASGQMVKLGEPT